LEISRCGIPAGDLNGPDDIRRQIQMRRHVIPAWQDVLEFVNAFLRTNNKPKDRANKRFPIFIDSSFARGLQTVA
jgi:hypothetical protein